MAASERLSFEQLSRRHGIKLAPVMRCSVEDCCSAVGKLIGYDSIMSASRMNSAFVLFLNSIEKVNNVVQSGVVIHDTFTPVMPLAQPAKKIVLSNVPPFINDDLLSTELSRHGKLVSQMKRLPLNCKSPLLRHVVCFRRQVYMILNNNAEELNVAFKFRFDGFDYVVFVTSETMKCFECGQEGHIRRSCPERIESDSDADTDIIAQVQVGNVSNVNSKESTGDKASTSAVGGDEVVDVDKALNTDNSMEREINMKPDEVAAVAGSLLEEDEMDAGPMSDEVSFKMPSTKRKRPKSTVEKERVERTSDVHPDKPANNDCSSTFEDSESDIKIVRDRRSAYTVEKIKTFLQKTKNMKNVRIADYFPESRMFLESAVALMRGEGKEHFTAQETYRLKKFVSKLRLELQSEDGFETA